MNKCENNDEPFIRRYQSLVSEWGNPVLRKQDEPTLHREIPITKLQETNNNQFLNFQCLKHWNFEFVWNTWNFEFLISACNAGGALGELKHLSTRRKIKQ